MTYFSQQKKSLEQKLNNNKSLGPGSYSADKQAKLNRMYAPFGSLAKKVGAVKKQTQQCFLGPGAYQISREIMKPSIIQYQNQKCIIVKINNDGGSQFKSKIQRFAGNTEHNNPGPGSYNTESMPHLHQKNRTRSLGGVATKMKQLYNRQYLEPRKPTLISDPLNIQQCQQIAESNKKKPKGCVRWSLNQKQRFKTQPREIITEQEQSYMIDKVNDERKKSKRRQNSSFFASTSVKSTFDPLIYKTANPLKIEVRKMLGYSDQSPGPGSYKIQTQQNNRPLKPIKFQFFGSTADRFKHESTQSNQIGPGEYYSLQKAQKSISQHKIKKPLRERKKNQQQESEILQQINIGPGCYEVSSKNHPSYNVKIKNGQASFGSKKSRFDEVKINRNNNIQAQFHSFMAVQDIERKNRLEEAIEQRKQMFQKKNNAIFQSSSKRNCFQDYKHFESTPFGVYQVNSNDIGIRIQKHKQYDKQIEECNLKKAAFLSTQNRFKDQKEQEVIHKDCWCQIREVEKRSIQHMSPAFLSKARKSQVFEQSNNRGPSVGHYSKQTTFVKQSFNTRFIKQNQNKVKKLKLWRDKNN